MRYLSIIIVAVMLAAPAYAKELSLMQPFKTLRDDTKIPVFDRYSGSQALTVGTIKDFVKTRTSVNIMDYIPPNLQAGVLSYAGTTALDTYIALAIATGKPVYCPPGRYTHSGTITLNKTGGGLIADADAGKVIFSTSYQGVGVRLGVFDWDGSTDNFSIDPRTGSAFVDGRTGAGNHTAYGYWARYHITLRNITFENTAANRSGTVGVRLSGAPYSTLENIRFVGYENGVSVGPYSSYSKFSEIYGGPAEVTDVNFKYVDGTYPQSVIKITGEAPDTGVPTNDWLYADTINHYSNITGHWVTKGAVWFTGRAWGDATVNNIIAAGRDDGAAGVLFESEEGQVYSTKVTVLGVDMDGTADAVVKFTGPDFSLITLGGISAKGGAVDATVKTNGRANVMPSPGSHGVNSLLDFSDIHAVPNSNIKATFGSRDSAPKIVSTSLTAGGSLTVGVTYYYTVTTLTDTGESVASPEVSATPTFGNQSVTINLTRLPFATGYKIYRSTSSGVYGASSLLHTITGNATASYVDTGGSLSTGTPPTQSTATLPILNFGGESLTSTPVAIDVKNTDGYTAGQQIRLWSDYASSTGGGGIMLAHTNGAGAFPVSGDRLGFILGGSFDGSSGVLIPHSGAGIQVKAAGNWSNTSYPTDLAFETASAGSTTRTTRLTVGSDGKLIVGAGGQICFPDNTCFSTAPAAATAAGSPGQGQFRAGDGTFTAYPSFSTDGDTIFFKKNFADNKPRWQVYNDSGALKAYADYTGNIWAESFHLNSGATVATVDDTVYNATTWDGDTTTAPTRNAVRDKFVSVDAAVTAAATQWSNGASSSIYYSSGNVGFGTNAPTTQIDSNSTTAINTARIRDTVTSAAGGGVLALMHNNATAGVSSADRLGYVSWGFLKADGTTAQSGILMEGYAVGAGDDTHKGAELRLSTAPSGSNTRAEHWRFTDYGTLRFIPMAQPSSGSEGDCYWDSTSHKLTCYTGSAWQAAW